MSNPIPNLGLLATLFTRLRALASTSGKPSISGISTIGHQDYGREVLKGLSGSVEAGLPWRELSQGWAFRLFTFTDLV